MKRYDKQAWIDWVGKQEGLPIYKELLNDGRMKWDEEANSLTAGATIVLKQSWFVNETKNGAVCKTCGKDKGLTLDHIVPVQILLQFGIDERRTFMPDNYRILCKYCNSMKSNKLDFTDPKTKEILLVLLSEV